MTQLSDAVAAAQAALANVNAAANAVAQFIANDASTTALNAANADAAAAVTNLGTLTEGINTAAATLNALANPAPAPAAPAA